MKNIVINVIDSDTFSFREILDKEFDVDSCYETHELEYTKENNGIEFKFQFQNLDADECYVNEIGDNSISPGFLKYEQNKNSVCKTFNFVSIINTTAGMAYTQYNLNEIKKGLYKLQDSKKEIIFNIVLVFVSNKEFEFKNFSEEELEGIKEFQNKMEIPIENIINFGDYSKKEFQSSFILESIYNIFGKFNKQLILKNDNEILELVYNQIVSTTNNVELLDMYNQLVNVEYSKLEYKLKELVNTFKRKLDVHVTLGVLLMEHDIILYNNLRVFYLISKMELNYGLYRLLYNLFEGIESKEYIKLFPLQSYNYSIENVTASSQIKLSSRITQCGNLSIFQINCNNNFQSLIETDHSYQNKSCSITWIIDYKYWDILKWLLEVKNNEMELSDQIKWQSIALTRSSYNGDLEMFKYLINHCNCKVNVDSEHKENEIQMNSFHYSALNGRLNIMKYICEHLNYTNINGKSSDFKGMSAIHYAAEKCQREIIDYLIDTKNVNINQTDDYGEIPLFKAAKNYKYQRDKEFRLSFCNYLINERNSNITCFSKEYGREINIQDEYLKESSYSFCTIL